MKRVSYLKIEIALLENDGGIYANDVDIKLVIYVSRSFVSSIKFEIIDERIIEKIYIVDLRY